MTANPRPINVGKARVSRRDGALAVFVELRGVNCPGSTYDLQCDPKTDQLIGPTSRPSSASTAPSAS